MPLGIPLESGQVRRGCACGVPLSTPQYMAKPNVGISGGLGDAWGDFQAARQAYFTNRTPEALATLETAKKALMLERINARPLSSFAPGGGGGWGGGYGGGWRRHHRRHRRHGWGSGGWRGERFGNAWRGSGGALTASAAPIGTGVPTQSSPPLAVMGPAAAAPVAATAPVPVASAAPGGLPYGSTFTPKETVAGLLGLLGLGVDAVHATGQRTARVRRSYQGPVTQQLRARTEAEMQRFRPHHLHEQMTEYTFKPKPGGVEGLVQDILVGIGVMDPITHYEPELANDLPRVYSKEADLVSRYLVDLKGLRSGGGQRELTPALNRLVNLVDSLRPAYTIAGSRPGKRERDKLGELVKGVWDFRHDFGLAKKKYGWNPVQVENPETGEAAPASSAPPVAPQGEAFPWGPVLAGAAILLIAAGNR